MIIRPTQLSFAPATHNTQAVVEAITAEMHRHQDALRVSCDLRVRHHHHPLCRDLNFGYHLGQQGGNDIAQNKSSQLATRPSVDQRAPSGLALHNSFWVTSGHDAGQRLQPAGGPRLLICPERTVAPSSRGDPLDAPGTTADACGGNSDLAYPIGPVLVSTRQYSLVLFTWPAVIHVKRRAEGDSHDVCPTSTSKIALTLMRESSR